MDDKCCWIDTHAHVDAPELWPTEPKGAAVYPPALPPWAVAATQQGVRLCVIPGVERRNWPTVQALAHDCGHAYAWGIHPLYVPQANEADLDALDTALARHAHDPRLVAVGEIGLDFFLPTLTSADMRERQQRFYRAQLQLAHQHHLPVLLHVRKSVDLIVKHLRAVRVTGGIAHAFNGSTVQAQALMGLGFALGLGGAVTFDAARHLRLLAAHLPLQHLVLETDAPDMPPQWLYTTAAQRAAGQAQGINSPAELPRIAQVVADLRGIPLHVLAQQTTANALAVLPRLTRLL